MSLQALILVAIGLSMDAFGASISRGSAVGRLPLGRSAAIAGLFGLFAVIAPVIGWSVGAAFYDLIEAVDHWIAFCLLSAIGIKMIVDARGGARGDTTGGAVGGVVIPALFAATGRYDLMFLVAGGAMGIAALCTLPGRANAG